MRSLPSLLSFIHRQSYDANLLESLVVIVVVADAATIDTANARAGAVRVVATTVCDHRNSRRRAGISTVAAVFLLQAVAVEWRTVAMWLFVVGGLNGLMISCLNQNTITLLQQNVLQRFVTHTFSFSSNLRARNRGSKPDNELSLLLGGEPHSTYSTILTPRPPVVSRGLKLQKD